MKILLSMTIASSVLFAHNAFSADFTFNVPVNYTNLAEEVAFVGVICSVYASDTAPATSSVISAGVLLGSKLDYRNPTNGDLNETIKITINLENDVASLAKSWKCKASPCAGKSSRSCSVFKAKEGTVPVTVRSGIFQTNKRQAQSRINERQIMIQQPPK